MRSLRVIKIMGWVCIAIGGLSVCNNLSQLVTGVMGADERMAEGEGLPAIMKEQGQAQYKALQHGAFRGYLGVQGAVGSLMALVLVAAGIGLLQVRGWGRRLALGWGYYAVVGAVVYVVMVNRYLLPEVLAVSDEPMPAFGRLIFAGLFLLVLWLFPVVLLTVMSLKSIRQAFDRPAGALGATPSTLVGAARPAARAVPPSEPAPTTAETPQPPQSTPPSPPAKLTWRDDPWNDPDAT